MFDFFMLVRCILIAVNKSVDGMKLIQLLLCEGITANLFVPSACGLIQSLLQTQGSETLI